MGTIPEHLRPGDIVARDSNRWDVVFFKHYGVYVGDGKIINFDGDTLQNARIIETTWEQFIAKSVFIYKIESQYITPEQRQQSVNRAKEILENRELARKYNPLFFNCESFARYCLFGTVETHEPIRAILGTVASVSPQVRQVIMLALSVFWDVESMVIDGSGVLSTTFEPIFGCLQIITSVTGTVVRICETIRAKGSLSLEDLQKILLADLAPNSGALLTGILIVLISVGVIAAIGLGAPPIIATLCTGICGALFIIGGNSKAKMKEALNKIRISRRNAENPCLVQKKQNKENSESELLRDFLPAQFVNALEDASYVGNAVYDAEFRNFFQTLIKHAGSSLLAGCQ